jgi:predicted nucleotidyltransferase
MDAVEAHRFADKKYRDANPEKVYQKVKKYLYIRRENPEYLAKYRFDDKIRKRLKKEVQQEFKTFLLILIDN